jgi:ABC-type antimicrobial peptide transport system permease subunit
MSDGPALPVIVDGETYVNGLPIPSRTNRKNFVIATILFCWGLVGYIVFAGDPQNSLHQSALSWGFMLMASVIFAYVFGAVIDNSNFLKAAKSPDSK